MMVAGIPIQVTFLAIVTLTVGLAILIVVLASAWWGED